MKYRRTIFTDYRRVQSQRDTPTESHISEAPSFSTRCPTATVIESVWTPKRLPSPTLHRILNGLSFREK